MCESLPFSKCIIVNARGFKGGLWVVWNEEEIKLELIKKIDQEIHAIVKMIFPPQASFITGRRGSDNTIIVQEAIHKLKKKKNGKLGFCAIKIDLMKTFDKLEWNFVKEALHHFDFPKPPTNLIVGCVSTSRLAVLHNGTPTEWIIPSRGLDRVAPSPLISLYYAWNSCL
ncbi:hypothetical protein ACH5RR_029237 [Cinchona calisaya]|uniref:Reverse transcriptase domain-containing protein n=1 Tax=Cinchona calisaya TaxID=153742 RepID=A0ABD2YSI2_9GENT